MVRRVGRVRGEVSWGFTGVLAGSTTCLREPAVRFGSRVFQREESKNKTNNNGSRNLRFDEEIDFSYLELSRSFDPIFKREKSVTTLYRPNFRVLIS